MQPEMKQSTMKGDKTMKEEYDLSTMKSRPNPYAKQLKKQVTMRLENEVIDYFKDMAKGAGIPYQSLINLYLRECMTSHRTLKMSWQ
jgi:uncharacterized protein (DUF4415 family)